MTPAARISAAIEVLDLIQSGQAAEQALSGWGRSHRFAGSKDRAAIRDHVFDALRRLRSSQILGGGEDGRSIMIGLLRGQGMNPEDLFTGEGHAPALISDAERSRFATPDGPTALDCPDWAYDEFQAGLKEDTDQILELLRHRAPVFLRVNLARITREEGIATLARDGVEARPHPLAGSALEVVENHRKVAGSEAYLSGFVELQDAASQALVDCLGITPGMRVLDYCAGGGGKALAMAALGAEVVAHDISPRRMKDLPDRARRAGVHIQTCATADLEALPKFDLVLADAPCSGSGSWRRDPQGKWQMSPDRLNKIQSIQRSILKEIPQYAVPGGMLAYATCSLFASENGDQIATVACDWDVQFKRQYTPLEGGDGFFVALLTREAQEA